MISVVGSEKQELRRGRRLSRANPNNITKKLTRTRRYSRQSFAQTATGMSSTMSTTTDNVNNNSKTKDTSNDSMEVVTECNLWDIDSMFEQIGCLGNGKFTSVFLAQKRNSEQELVAFKVVDIQRPGQEITIDTLFHEVETIKALTRTDTNIKGEKEKGGGGGTDNKDDDETPATTTTCQNRDDRKHIISIQNLYMTPHAVFIEMKYINGGTLAQQFIDQHDLPIQQQQQQQQQPFTERRIAWYILQLCDALTFIHERHVAHYNVTSENILIDASSGGRLVLIDFSSSAVVRRRHDNDDDRPVVENCMDTNEVGVGRISTESHYASPELLSIHRSKKMKDNDNGNKIASLSSDDDNYQTIDPFGVDAFGLGCVAFELVMKRRLVDIPFLLGVGGGGYDMKTLADVALEGKLNELLASSNHTEFYSDTLIQDVVLRLLDPNPQSRLVPSRNLSHHFRQDPRSPLLRPHVVASYPQQHRQHLTMDNIQLGTFVQRGPDWSDGNIDGGEGSIGVVVQLDPDSLYAEVLWSVFPNETTAAIYRIGQDCKMELSVGPTPLFPGAPNYGIVERSEEEDHLEYKIGSPFPISSIFSSLKIARITDDKLFLLPIHGFKVPNEYQTIPKMNGPQLRPPPSLSKLVLKEEESVIPPSWDLCRGELVLPNDEERRMVVSMFHETMPIDQYTILSIQRVQSSHLWNAYTLRRQAISHENWGIPNEIRLFHGTRFTKPEEIIADPVGFDPRFCDKGAFGRGSYFAVRADYSHHFRHEERSSTTFGYQMFLAKVLVGRVDDRRMFVDQITSQTLRRPKDGCHSVLGRSKFVNGTMSDIYIHYETSTQAYPEFLITYGTTQKEDQYQQQQQQQQQLGPTATGSSNGILGQIFSLVTGIPANKTK